MSSLARTGFTSSKQLLLQILERPDLVAAVRELPVSVLSGLIDRVGLEDAGELVALASGEQLQRLFDQDLWRAGAAGEDEGFRPERFALWLEVMAESGEDFLIERLCGLPRDLLTLAVHRLIRVVDLDALWERYTEPSDALHRLEHALDAALFEEWEEFRVLSRDPTHWDALWSALVALDRDHHDVLRQILEACCRLGAEDIDDLADGRCEALTSEAMLESDVTGAREDRRAAEGFVSAADARSFLALARRAEPGDARDPISRSYFRALERQSSRPSTIATTQASGQGGPKACVLELMGRIADATGIEPDRAPCTPAVASGTRGQGAGFVEPERAPDVFVVTESQVSLIEVGLAELRSRNPERFARRIEELHYLANVLITGSTGRRPRAVEALERAMDVCERGLLRTLGPNASLAQAVETLGTTTADQLFRIGFPD